MGNRGLHRVFPAEHAPLALVLLLALALRLLLWSGVPHLPANDEVEYVAVARDLLAGRGWVFYEHYRWLRAPLYPLFLAGSLWLAGGDLHRAALPNIAVSVATVYVVARLARALAGPRAELLAAALLALLWTHATFASLYMSETLFAFLFAAALLCLASHRASGDGRHPRARPPYLLPAAAGLLFGLATLTRSLTLLFVPVVLLWLVLRGAGARGWAGRALAAACFLACVALPIAPWTARNYLAYGEPILVETGLSFNLWFFSEPHESNNTIYKTLSSIRNPAERSAYATAKGLERLREDPAIMLRKLYPNWVYLWRVKPIQDRFLQASYYSDVELPLFAAALLFDDLLYLLVLLAALVGLVLGWPGRGQEAGGRSQEGWRPPATDRRGTTTSARRATHVVGLIHWAGSPWALCVAWLLYVVATVLLTHGEARYRHFLFPVLIPYAAGALASLRWPSALRPMGRAAAVVALWALAGWTLLPSYPWGWASQNLARGWPVLLGDMARGRGDLAVASEQYGRALAAHETPDVWLRLGDVRRAQGDTDAALDAYAHAVELTPPYPAASSRFGDLLREKRADDKARRAFAGYYTDPQQAVDWAWRELRPAPRASVDVGDGLDFGYVGGVYPAERLLGSDARWSGGRALLRLHSGPGQGGLLRLRLAAPRPDGRSVEARVCVEGDCRSIAVGPSWRTYLLPFAAPPDAPLTVELRSPTFTAPDGRHLGLLIDRVAFG